MKITDLNLYNVYRYEKLFSFEDEESIEKIKKEVALILDKYNSVESLIDFYKKCVKKGLNNLDEEVVEEFRFINSLGISYKFKTREEELKFLNLQRPREHKASAEAYNIKARYIFKGIDNLTDEEYEDYVRCCVIRNEIVVR